MTQMTMKLADRVARLGTETAFAVSAEATAFAQKGNEVFAFHLGDMNLRTPENVMEAATRAMRGRFVRSRSPPQPTTHVIGVAPTSRRNVSTCRSASSVWA